MKSFYVKIRYDEIQGTFLDIQSDAIDTGLHQKNIVRFLVARNRDLLIEDILQKSLPAVLGEHQVRSILLYLSSYQDFKNSLCDALCGQYRHDTNKIWKRSSQEVLMQCELQYVDVSRHSRQAAINPFTGQAVKDIDSCDYALLYNACWHKEHLISIEVKEGRVIKIGYE